MKIDLVSLLKSSDIFSSLSEEVIKNILKKFKKVSVGKNKYLFKQGDVSDHVYFLIRGRIGVFVKTKKRETRLINEIFPGFFIGELAALSREPSAVTAKVVSKSILLSLTSEDFFQLCTDYPSINFEIVKSTVKKSKNLLKLVSEDKNPHRHILILPANSEIDLTAFSKDIAKHRKSFHEIIFLSDLEKKSSEEFKHDISETEKNKKTLVYLIHSLDSTLAKLCFSQEHIDMIYLVANEDVNGALDANVQHRLNEFKYKIRPNLILFHQDGKKFPKRTSKWLNQYRFNLHLHVRVNKKEDWQRLLRFVTGKAVAVVFGGGGLRCWAQLGALRALKELKVPIDAVGGTSAGAIVAGYYAMKLSLDDPVDLRELSEIVRNTIKFTNVTWPALSFFSGNQYTEKLKDIFRNIRIENLWLPTFYVSTNLANNQQVISRKGYLWKTIRASTSVPWVFPPVLINNKLVVDGGILNNLPVDVMRKILPRAKVIAIELTKKAEDSNEYFYPETLYFWQIMLAKTGLAYSSYHFPHFLDIFLKSLLAGSSAKQEENGALADVLISPELAAYRFLNIKKNQEEELIQLGYEATIEQMKKF